jgi:aspartyl-tRNA(Asn)/glutamyl-tRNA(Gln) amidotransferase subunit C
MIGPMDKLTPEQVKNIAKLAKLELNDIEVKKFGKQLSETISYVDKLNEIDTSNIDPTNQVSGLKNVFREDIIKPSLDLSDVISPGNHTTGGYFKVKLILNKNK